jgi:hypothetical protein
MAPMAVGGRRSRPRRMSESAQRRQQEGHAIRLRVGGACDGPLASDFPVKGSPLMFAPLASILMSRAAPVAVNTERLLV